MDNSKFSRERSRVNFNSQSILVAKCLMIVVAVACCLQSRVEAKQTIAPNSKRPNIILFLVDDFGKQDLSCYGSSFYDTPNMDKLASSGVRFSNAYSAYSRCVSSRIGLLTGKFPCRVEYAAKKSKSKHHMPLSEITFGEALKEQGYQTCYIGKWHLGKEGGGPENQGFDTVVHTGSAGATGSYFYPFKVEKGHYVSNPVEGKEGDYLNDCLTEKAIDYVNSNKEKPFLMVLAHYAVHTPFEAPEDLERQYKKKLRKAGEKPGGKRTDADFIVDRQGQTKTKQNNPTYAAMVSNTDTSLGRLVDALKAAGIEDNTVIVLTSDHGGLSTRGIDSKRAMATSNLPYRQGKGSIFDGGTRVPLIVSWPGKFPAGQVSDTQVIGTDIYPTMLSLAGVDARPDQHVDGVSFIPALKGQKSTRPPMFWYKWMARPDSTGDTRALSLIDGNFKLISWIDEDLTELFDIASAPGEQNNIAEKFPEKTKAMLAKIEQLEAEAGNLREAGKKMLQRRIERKKKQQRGKAKPSEEPVGS